MDFAPSHPWTASIYILTVFQNLFPELSFRPDSRDVGPPSRGRPTPR